MYFKKIGSEIIILDKFNNICRTEGLKKWDEYILSKKKTSKRSILYWVDKTEGDYEEAYKLLKEYQNTSSLNKMIERYGKGNEHRLLDKYNVDFYIKELNLCIEFNGDFWHANPKIFNKNDMNPVNKLLASDIWEKDRKRLEEIRKYSNILIIWEDEVRKDFKQAVLKCTRYIMEVENGNNRN